MERGGSLKSYVVGLQKAGVTNVTGAVVPGAGHFPQEEATQATWGLLQHFAEGCATHDR